MSVGDISAWISHFNGQARDGNVAHGRRYQVYGGRSPFVIDNSKSRKRLVTRYNLVDDSVQQETTDDSKIKLQIVNPVEQSIKQAVQQDKELEKSEGVELEELKPTAMTTSELVEVFSGKRKRVSSNHSKPRRKRPKIYDDIFS